MALRRADRHAGSGSGKKEPYFELCLEAIDEMIFAIGKEASINLRMLVPVHAKEYLNRENLSGQF
jgi:hypothetical protein